MSHLGLDCVRHFCLKHAEAKLIIKEDRELPNCKLCGMHTHNIPHHQKREGANSMTMAKFYMAVVQAVLLYGADSWVISKRNWSKLRAFHNTALRYMTGQHIKKKADGTYKYPCHKDLQWKCGLFSIETYIERRRGTLNKYMEENQSKLMEEARRTTKPV